MFEVSSWHRGCTIANRVPRRARGLRRSTFSGREPLGYDEERCRGFDMAVYDADAAKLGRFDVVFFFGVLCHLRHPLLALDKVAALCDREIYVESAILDDFSPYRGGLGHG